MTKWTDPKLSSEVLGITPGKKFESLDQILQVNRDQGSIIVSPRIIESARDQWLPEKPLEFYVDFESVSDLNDDFSKMPERAGTPMIFMIGCGHMERGEWVCRQFTASLITPSEARRFLEEWFAHMNLEYRYCKPE